LRTAIHLLLTYLLLRRLSLAIGKSVPKIIINDTVKLLVVYYNVIIFVTKLFPYIFISKIYLYFSSVNGQPKEPAL